MNIKYDNKKWIFELLNKKSNSQLKNQSKSDGDNKSYFYISITYKTKTIKHCGQGKKNPLALYWIIVLTAQNIKL